MQRTSKVLLYLLYLVIVITLSGLILASSKTSPKASPKTTKSPATSQHHSQPAKPAAPSKKPTPAPAPAKSSTSASNSSQPLSNTGPGNVVGLFVLATIAGTVLYRRIMISRAG